MSRARLSIPCRLGIVVVVMSMVCRSTAADLPANFSKLSLASNDVVAFIGGESVVAQGENGHLESLLAVAFPGRGVTFRNLGREGDTVFEQPRDVNFPTLLQQLKSTKATVIFCEFGAAESRDGAAAVTDFLAAYDRLCDALQRRTSQIVLVTPVAFEPSRAVAKTDVEARNAVRGLYVGAIKRLGRRRGLPVVNAFHHTLRDTFRRPLTSDGTHLSDWRPRYVACAVATALRESQPWVAMSDDGSWMPPELERVRQAVIEKNRLWFAYSRPMNWAFLGGDRQFVPSSRDPNDLKSRIFPREMEKYVPLIEAADAKIEELAKVAGSPPPPATQPPSTR